MASRIAELLNKARSASFFGREKELALLDDLNNDDAGQPFFLLHLHGTAGQGKTSLLKRYREICDAHNCLNINVDGREIEPTPTGFLEALLPQVRSESVDNFFDVLAEMEKRVVLFIDSYERLSGIDDWMRKDFLPQLPDNVRTVMGGRKAPSGAFLADPGWQALMRVAQLRNFNPAESAAFLERRNVPQDKIQPILDFTHGHPLALSIVTDIFEQRPDRLFLPHESPDVLHTLLDHFIQEVPSPEHRIALETCALVHLTTESLLGEAMGLAHADTYFDWLRSLSFVESGRFGLYPNDLARKALVADLRWRNPDRFAELHERAGLYYKRRIKEVSGEMQRAFLYELVFLHRTNPLVR
ncbi:MAG: ATP-binding protein, partial [Bacteroidota bacterium]